jgi:hypothetical protein
MKVFFGLLLIVNIAFAVFQWLMPYEQLFVERKKIPAAEQLQLLTDANTQVVSEAEVVAKVEAETDALEAAVARIEKEVEAERANLVNEDSSDKRVCYTIGPIKDKARATQVEPREGIPGRYGFHRRTQEPRRSGQEREQACLQRHHRSHHRQ